MVPGRPRLGLRRRTVAIALGASIAIAIGGGLGIESASASTKSRLAVSLNSDRSSAARLDGSRVNGKIYVFVRNSKKLDKVDFYVDSPQWRNGPPVRTDKKAPFDLAGTKADGTARPYDTAKLADGTHTIRVVMTWADGTTDLHPAGALQGPQRGGGTDTHPHHANHHRVAHERTDHNSTHHNSTDDGTHHNSTGHDGPNHDSSNYDGTDDHGTDDYGTDHNGTDHNSAHGYGYTA